MTTIGVLALQGDFREHIATLKRLGVEAREVRLPTDLAGLDGLIIPGGESTSIGKLLVQYGLRPPIKAAAAEGFPVYGSCAGLILLARAIRGGTTLDGLEQPLLGLMDIVVQRNAFGSQVDSFEADLEIEGLDGEPFRGIFIRAPVVASVGPAVDVLAELADGRVVAARQGSLLVTAFHPELTPDLRMHELFVRLVRECARPFPAETVAVEGARP